MGIDHRDLDAEILLLGASALGRGGIESTVNMLGRRGQGESNTLDILPVKGSEEPIWGQLGFILGEKLPDDALFRRAALPQGWRKVRTDHYMWSKILDERDRVRGTIFYKADFWDREAFMSPSRRFYIRQCYEFPRYVRDNTIVIDVTDCDRVVHRIVQDLPDRRKNEQEHYRVLKTVEGVMLAECRAWLDKVAPGWEDPLGQWDLPDLPTIEDLAVACHAHYRVDWYDVTGEHDSFGIVEGRVEEDGKQVYAFICRYHKRRPRRAYDAYTLDWDGIYRNDCPYAGRNPHGREMSEDTDWDESSRRRAGEAAMAQCKAWLDENAPGWEKDEATVSMDARQKGEIVRQKDCPENAY